jgi:AbrB family looped-hinge helix DNA binding protein
MSETAKVGKRYAVVVPKSVRKKVKLEEGQRVWIRAHDDQIIIEPLPKDPSAVFAELIPDQYTEQKYDEKAEEFLMKNARARH